MNISSTAEHQKLTLKRGLQTSLRVHGDAPYVMISDPLTSAYFQLPVDEWQIAQAFDGKRTLNQIIQALSEVHEPETILAIAKWLIQNGLATTANPLGPNGPSNSSPTNNSWSARLQRLSQLGRWNPLFIRVRLPSPSRLLEILEPIFGQFFSTSFVGVWLVVCALGLGGVLAQWPRFRNSLDDVFLDGNWVTLLLVWLVLKLVHELAHGIACVRLGGNVNQWGLMLILFSPIAWVDVTSAWGFRSKWARMFVSAAGMYAELFLAGVAAIVWTWSEDETLARVARDAILAASVGTTLFNLNFLMRFDGYYILADWLEISNLYGLGSQYLQYLVRRYVLGDISAAREAGQFTALIRVYAIAAFVWRILLMSGILVVASGMFQGVGLVLAVFSTLLWFGVPLASFLLQAFGNTSSAATRWRVAGMLAVGLAMLFVTLQLRWPGSASAFGVVDYSPRRTIRIDSPGFVRQVLVKRGQDVVRGQVLLQLENTKIQQLLADVQLQIDEGEIRRRVLHRENRMADYIAHNQRMESLTQQHAQLAARVDGLTIRAPMDGTVISADLDSTLGSYLNTGAEVMVVGARERKVIRLAIPQTSIAYFREQVGSSLRYRVRGRQLSCEGRLDKILPQAQLRVDEMAALTVPHGGALTVQPQANGEMAWVTPHFAAELAIAEEDADLLRAGEVCRCNLRGGGQSVYEMLRNRVRTANSNTN